MSEFTPAQLDALEDALESLETPAKLEVWRSQVDATLGARLDEYAALLQWTREALPPEEVPAGLLNAVLAEAEAAPEQSAVALSAAAAVPPKRGWWQRFGAALAIPAVALAGSAALVLWMVSDVSEAPAPSMVAQAESAALERTVPPQAAPPEEEPAPGAPADAAAPSILEDEALAVAPLEAVPDGTNGGLGAARSSGAKNSIALEDRFEQAAPTKARPASDTMARRRAAPTSVPAAPPAPASKKSSAYEPLSELRDDGVAETSKEAKKTKGSSAADKAWNILEQADVLRRRGDCSAARAYYQGTSTHEDPRVSARAHAGLGLCEAAGGNPEAAEKHYAKARAIDPEVRTFIAGELRRTSKKAKPTTSTQ